MNQQGGLSDEMKLFAVGNDTDDELRYLSVSK